MIIIYYLETYLIILDALYFEETMLKSEAIDISIKGEEFKVFFEKKVTEYNSKEWNTIWSMWKVFFNVERYYRNGRKLLIIHYSFS